MHGQAASERAEARAKAWQESSLSHSHADKMQQLADMGFPPQQAEQALMEADGDFDKALRLLME